MRIVHHLFRILPIALLGFLATPGCKPRGEEKPDLIVLQTGRLRGNIYPVGLQSNAPLQHYPYLAGYIRSVREQAAKDGIPVLLVDLGDSLSGSFASHVTGSENVVAFFNALDYDAVALSNLDFAATPELLGKLKARVLNPFAGPDGAPATEGTAFAQIIDKGPISVDLMANFYGDLDPAIRPDRFPAWFGKVSSGVVPLREYPPPGSPPRGGLQLLSWMKFESPEEPPEAFLARLREAGIDAILAHQVYGSGRREVWSQGGVLPWNPPVSMNILRDNGGFALARADLKKDGDGWKVLRQEIVPMTANTSPADENVVREISRFEAAIAAADRTIAELPSALDQDQILSAYLDALLGIPGTDLAIYSRQSIRSDWPAGPLRNSTVYNSLPWTTAIVQVTLTPDQIEAATSALGLSFRPRDGAPTDALVVTTSEFFWRLISAHLGLPVERAKPAGQPSEFDFFVEALGRRPELLTARVSKPEPSAKESP